ncbi:MAG: hypothetical protein EA426_05940 [Spirochaetaceae bacterium]|nr:MAG: hypothetical protein EA426_05940 [Spirochaetaceae bacterium]
MTREEFTATLEQAEPPASLSDALRALWLDKKSDWKRSHGVVQDMPGKTGSRIHAYLHRKEGDLGNAQYWYSKAGATMPSGTLDEEWEFLVDEVVAGRL